MKRVIFLLILLPLLNCGEAGRSLAKQDQANTSALNCDAHLDREDMDAYEACVGRIPTFWKLAANSVKKPAGDLEISKEGEYLVARQRYCRFYQGQPLPAPIHALFCELYVFRLEHGREAAFRRGLWSGLGLTAAAVAVWKNADRLFGGGK